MLTTVSDLTRLLLSLQYIKCITGLRSTVQTEDQYRLGRTSLLHPLITLVEHRLDTSLMSSRQNDISHLQRTVLHQYGRYIATSLVQRRLDDRTNRTFFRIRFQIQQVGLQQYLLQQLLDTNTFLSGDLLTLVLTTPVFHQVIHIRQLLLDLLRVSMWLIDFINSENNRNTGSRSVINRLNRLRHHVIISGHDNNRDIRHLRATGTHSGKRLVTRSIQERDTAAILQLHVVGSDMLRDTTGLTGDYVRATDIIQ